MFWKSFFIKKQKDKKITLKEVVFPISYVFITSFKSEK